MPGEKETQSRSATIFHAKALLSEISKRFKGANKLIDEYKKTMKNIYSENKDDIRLLFKKSIEMKNKREEDPEFFEIMVKITDYWAEVEKVVLGPVIIVTKDIEYFLSKKEIWVSSREVIVVENTLNAIELIKNISSDSRFRYGPPVSTLVIDPREIKVFEDLNRVKTIVEGNTRLIGELLILD